MEIPWSTIIWLGIAVFVYIFGIYEGRGQGYKKRKAEEEQERKEKPQTVAPPVTVKVDDPGLMRIKNENGYLTLDLDGVRVNPSSLTADQRKRLIEMLTVIRPWLEGRPAAVSAPPAPSPVPAQPTPIPPPQTGLPPRLSPQPSAPETVRPTLAKSPTSEKDSAPPATGIVGQIESILQARLAGTTLEGRGIHLSNSPEGGVIVNVGLQRFNGIDEVTDPEIKAVLRAAIAEWENKYTPGL